MGQWGQAIDVFLSGTKEIFYCKSHDLPVPVLCALCGLTAVFRINSFNSSPLRMAATIFCKEWTRNAVCPSCA